jgi:hypothetical protein
MENSTVLKISGDRISGAREASYPGSDKRLKFVARRKQNFQRPTTGSPDLFSASVTSLHYKFRTGHNTQHQQWNATESLKLSGSLSKKS